SLAFALATREGSQELDQALTLLEENRRGRAESTDDQRTRAVVLALHPGRQGEAIRLLEDLGKRQPLTTDEQFLLAKLYEAAGDWRRAREKLLSLVTAQGSRPEEAGRFALYLSHYVGGLLHRGEVAEARLWLARLEKADPSSLRTLDLKV